MVFATITWLLCDYWKLWLGLFLVQGVIGVIIFEWAWKRTERVRLGEEACWAEFPSFRKPESHRWSRSLFYPGCFLMLIPRLIFIFFTLGVIGVCFKILYHGRSMDVPLSGFRKTLYNRAIWFLVPCLLIGFG